MSSAQVVSLHGQRQPAASTPATTPDAALCRRTSKLLMLTHTDKALEALFTQADDRLFDMSGQGWNASGMEDLRALRKNRTAFIQRHRAYIEAVWSQWEKGQLGDQPIVMKNAQSLGLSLLEKEDLERQIACNQLSTVVGRQHKEILSGLHGVFLKLEGHRYLASQDNLSQENAPWSPERLAAAFKSALTVAELSTAGELVLYKLYERDLHEALQKAYHEIGQTFVRQGFTITAVRTRPTPTPTASRGPAGSGIGPVQDASPGQPGWSDQVAAEVTQLLGGAVPVREARHDVYSDARGVQWTMQDFANLLTRLRPASRTTDPTEASRPRSVLASNQAMEVLSWVQHQPPMDAPAQLKLFEDGVSLATQIKQMVLRHAERMGMAPSGASMSESEEDAVDLVSMLFEVLLADRHVARSAQETMIKLIVPYIRVAVMDKRLFMQKAHPAC